MPRPIYLEGDLSSKTGDNESFLDFSEERLGNIIGGGSGEQDGDTLPGGWEGTDDATSTAPSDLSESPQSAHDLLLAEDPDNSIGRAYGGGIGVEEGGAVDLKGTPIEESRDWEHDPVEEAN